MRPTVLAAGTVIVLLLPVLAVAAIAGSVIPAATSATTCADPAAAPAGGWRAPLNGRYVVTSGFGTRYHPVLHTTKLHTGIDLVATGDKTVVAAATGTVTTRGYNTAYGNQVVLDHGNGTRTRYAHMTTPSPVRPGRQAGAGTRLGTQGATGYVTGAHLHFEVIRHGRPVDPRPFMASHGAPLDGGTTAAGRPATRRPPPHRPDSLSSGGRPAPLTALRTDGRRVTLDAEQLANAATIIRTGRRSGAGNRGVIIALMAALQESTLRNLPYGDRDSLGLFQQRAGWGSPGQRRNPIYAARAFFGGPAGPNHGNPPGLLDTYGWRSMRLGHAAQAVQVSAFPRAYDAWEPVARALLARAGDVAGPAGCAAGTVGERAPATPRPQDARATTRGGR